MEANNFGAYRLVKGSSVLKFSKTERESSRVQSHAAPLSS